MTHILQRAANAVYPVAVSPCGGYQPIGAVLLTRRIFEAFAIGSGAFQHGHTYMGLPMAAPPRSRCRTSSAATICWPTSL